MATEPTVQRYAAFSDTPTGGNPAGVVLNATGLSADAMQAIAAAVGYSETAFLVPDRSTTGGRIRYFAPAGEVDFCGHATIATAVALGFAHGPGHYLLATNVGSIGVVAQARGDGFVGSLESPPLDCLPLAPELLLRLLTTFGWTSADLHPAYPPAIGYGGNRHPVLVVRDLATLIRLDYDFAALQRLCREQAWITIQACTPTGPAQWRARNPFPWGGVREDPATGAAAAALAAYLSDLGLIGPAGRFTIRQGIEMGRPSVLHVKLLGRTALITGSAVPIPGP